MAGRNSGIKTAADFFPELRIMQINTCWKDNSNYFLMSMALFSGTEYTGCGNQIKSTVISVYFQIEPFEIREFMVMFYFFPNKCWTSRNPICTPLGCHFLGVVELDHKILELYCYKHCSEIKYSTLFRSGVFSFHHFVAIW
jgi:hypothetical protein